MSLNYNKLWKMLIDKKMSKSELVKRSKISTNAMARMGKNEDNCRLSSNSWARHSDRCPRNNYKGKQNCNCFYRSEKNAR